MPNTVSKESIVLPFRDRIHAAHMLAERLMQFRNQDAVIVALSANAAPIASKLHQLLGLPMQMVLCGRIRHPSVASGSLGSVSGEEVALRENLDVPQDYVAHQLKMIQHSQQAQEHLGSDKKESFDGKVVIVVDDLLRTTDSALAALRRIRKQNPSMIILTSPVIVDDVVHELCPDVADEVICLHNPVQFHHFGEYYEDFPDVTDAEVTACMNSLD